MQRNQLEGFVVTVRVDAPPFTMTLGSVTLAVSFTVMVVSIELMGELY